VAVLAEVWRGGPAARVTKTIYEAIREPRVFCEAVGKPGPGMVASPEGPIRQCPWLQRIAHRDRVSSGESIVPMPRQSLPVAHGRQTNEHLKHPRKRRTILGVEGRIPVLELACSEFRNFHVTTVDCDVYGRLSETLATALEEEKLN
jgi:hypothetical protein